MTLFLYKSGRRGTPERPAGPDEFFYGAARLARLGRHVDVLDADDVARLAGAQSVGAARGWAWRVARAPIAAVLPGFPSIIASHFSARAVRARLEAAGTVVATTTGIAYALATLKATGRLDARVVVIAMGILADSLPQPQRALFAMLLRHAEIVTLSTAEAGFLRARLPGHPGVSDIPFGVDARFWSPAEPGATAGAPYVLAIGNDLQRDWSTLIAAWGPDLPNLRIVTNHRLPALPANVEHLRGDWHAGALSDEQVRDLYRGAALVVLPIRPTIQPSGQSACLQAMACGRPVLISDIEGLWDRGRLRDGESCYLVPPEDPAALGARVRATLRDDEGRAAVGRTARRLVETHFNSDRMGDALDAILETPMPGSDRRVA